MFKIMFQKKIVLFILSFLISINSVFSQLSKNDTDTLTKHLLILSAKWDSYSVNTSNTIFAKSNYSDKDLNIYFNNFFEKNKISTDLYNYLIYPTVFWLGAPVNQKIQKALFPVLINSIDSIYNKIPSFPSILKTNDSIRNDINNKTSLLGNITAKKFSLLNDVEISEIDLKLISLINRSSFLKRDRKFDVDSFAYVAKIATNIHEILIRNRNLDRTRIDLLINTIKLPVNYASIFTKHNLFISDNNSMSTSDLIFLDSLLSFVPKQIHNLRLMTHSGYLYSNNQSQIDGRYNIEAVNVLSTVGGFNENGFPNEVDPYFGDGFSLIASHELNHRIDPDYIYINPKRNNRRVELIKQAGNIKLNYLRSMFDDTFFTTNPQEFIASISNQYLTNSELTLKLALKRFDLGYKEPINQFLYFSDLYTAESDTTRFYLNDTKANLKYYKVPIKRNIDKNITEFSFNKRRYQFNLDINGNVTNYKAGPTEIFGNSTLCAGDTTSYTVASSNGFWYTNDTSVISIKNGFVKALANGNISIYYVDTTFRQKDTIIKKIIIYKTPDQPIITRDTQGFLISSNLFNNIWYKEGLALTDTTQKYKPTAPASYTTKTIQNGCISPMSNSYYYLVTDIINLSKDEFIKLAPNPFINQLNFDFVVKGYQKLNIEVYDVATGKKVASKQNLTAGMPIFLGQLSAGTYVIKVNSNDNKISYQFKMVKL